MHRALSIHIGVNDPQDPRAAPRRRLSHSEAAAWQMAEVANRAGFDATLVLRGREATRQAVDDALASAARTLGEGDTLLLTFSGHGAQKPDLDYEEPDGLDEAWCLYDDVLLDDKLTGFLRLFQPGVRIVVVSESCFGGGAVRTWEEEAGAATATATATATERRRTMRSAPSSRGGPAPETGVGPVASCIADPEDTCGIQASVLLLAAAGEGQPAVAGVYTEKLLEVWDDGAFRGSYCDLHACVCRRVSHTSSQEPQILMFGAPDPDFPLETAFHRNGGASRGTRASRGG